MFTPSSISRACDESEDRFFAKRTNEGVHVFAALLNNFAVGTIIAGFL